MEISVLDPLLLLLPTTFLFNLPLFYPNKKQDYAPLLSTYLESFTAFKPWFLIRGLLVIIETTLQPHTNPRVFILYC